MKPRYIIVVMEQGTYEKVRSVKTDPVYWEELEELYREYREEYFDCEVIIEEVKQ